MKTHHKIAYKATYNMVALHNNFKYEVGQTYIHEGEIMLCLKGFHYCENPKDVLAYYTPSPEFVLLEIEILSDNIIKCLDKSVTDKIKVLRVIPLEEHKLFKVEGNTYNHKKSNGNEVWITYDERNNVIHYKDSNGNEAWRTYDERNNLTYYKDSKKFEEWYVYDERNNVKHYKNSDKYEVWNTYDERNNVIKSYSSQQEYDEFMKTINSKN